MVPLVSPATDLCLGSLIMQVQKSDDALSLDLVCHQSVDPPMGFVLEGQKKHIFNELLALPGEKRTCLEFMMVFLGTHRLLFTSAT